MKRNITLHEFKIEGYTEPVDISPYILDRFVLAFLVEGEALVEIDGNNFLLGPGQIFLIPESNTIIVKQNAMAINSISSLCAVLRIHPMSPRVYASVVEFQKGMQMIPKMINIILKYL